VSATDFDLAERVDAVLRELSPGDRRVAVTAIVYQASDSQLRRIVAWAEERQRMGNESVRARQRQRIADALERTTSALDRHGLTADHIWRARNTSSVIKDLGIKGQPTHCAECDATLTGRARTGRLRLYCNQACRQKHYLRGKRSRSREASQ
jgi:hypothetical protein